MAPAAPPAEAEPEAEPSFQYKQPDAGQASRLVALRAQQAAGETGEHTQDEDGDADTTGTADAGACDADAASTPTASGSPDAAGPATPAVSADPSAALADGSCEPAGANEAGERPSAAFARLTRVSPAGSLAASEQSSAAASRVDGSWTAAAAGGFVGGGATVSAARQVRQELGDEAADRWVGSWLPAGVAHSRVTELQRPNGTARGTTASPS